MELGEDGMSTATFVSYAMKSMECGSANLRAKAVGE